MSIILLLLNFIIPAADAAVVTCTGGDSDNYGTMVCTTAICNIASDPSIGCPDGGPVTPDGAEQCYFAGTTYLIKMATVTSGVYEFYGINRVELLNFCATGVTGYASPSPTPKSVNGIYDCFESQIGTIQGDADSVGICNNL